MDVEWTGPDAVIPSALLRTAAAKHPKLGPLLSDTVMRLDSSTYEISWSGRYRVDLLNRQVEIPVVTPEGNREEALLWAELVFLGKLVFELGRANAHPMPNESQQDYTRRLVRLRGSAEAKGMWDQMEALGQMVEAGLLTKDDVPAELHPLFDHVSRHDRADSQAWGQFLLQVGGISIQGTTTLYDMWRADAQSSWETAQGLDG